jgi:Putative prokaryotic signal transducing protein
MSEELKTVTSVTSEAEADLICSRLREEGIPAMVRRIVGGGQWEPIGGSNVLVNEGDWERASALLKADEAPVSEEELTRLSEEAGREAGE